MREEEIHILLRKAEAERDRAIEAAETKYHQDRSAIQRVWELSRELLTGTESPLAAPAPGAFVPVGPRGGTADAAIDGPNRAGTLRQGLKMVGRRGEHVTAQVLFDRLPPEIAEKSSVASVSATVGAMAEKKDWFERVVHGRGGRPSVYVVLGDPADNVEMPHPENRVDDQPTIFEGEQGAVDPAQ